MRYRWTILGLGTAAQAAYSLVAVGLPALSPALKSHYRLSLGEIAIVLAATGIGSLPALLPWGFATDRFGERVVIAVGLGGAGLVLFATAWTTSFGALTATLVVAGALGSSVNAATGRAVMGWFGAEERGLALGIRQTSVPLGGALAAATLPAIAVAGGTKVAFVALGIACIATAVTATIWLRDRPFDGGVEAPSLTTTPLRDRAVWRLSSGGALYYVAQGMMLTFVVLFLHEQRGMSAGAAAGVFAAMHAIGGVARITVGRISDRMHARMKPLRRIGVTIAIGMALAASVLDAPLWVLIPVFLFAGVASVAWNGLSFTATAETAGRARSGAALGLQQTALGVSSVVVPIAFAAIVESTSWRTAFALSAIGPLAGLLALRRVPEPAAAASAASRLPDARSPETSAIPPAAR